MWEVNIREMEIRYHNQEVSEYMNICVNKPKLQQTNLHYVKPAD